MADKQKLVELNSISAGYQDRLVLENINLTLFEQDFLGVIGPNGSGKTTLLKTLLGLIKPFKGSIRFYFDHDNDHDPRKRIGYLPQQTMFDRKFPITVKDVVFSGLCSRVGLFKAFSNRDRELVDHTLESMGIAELKHRAIGSLSGGQMQRVFLARALVSSPSILILDEPDTFVDQTFAHTFYETLKELNRQMAIILVSHDLGIISSHVKTIACINRTLYYHDSNIIDGKLLESYHCPIDLITHGDLPHRVLKKHGE